ncbi:acyltransferase [Roseateles sp. DXS20W]|uniref:Acyltransferase n=1 Tax=Pelomonas lactea TaxID=3299030 RepID=A0ABW7GSH4_9BURK
MRVFLNRLRRRLVRLIGFRMLFGETGAPYSRIAPSTCIEGEAGLELADHVFIGQFNFIDASAGLLIEEGVQITNFCSIVTHTTHNALRINGRRFAVVGGEPPGYVKAPVRLGAYSFVGPHSLIEPGSVLGKGAMLCAYSQLRGVAPDFAIMAGQPARQVGDTRERDAALLARHPELREAYEAWAGKS